MAKLDSAKEELGWLKVVFAVVTAIGASLVAWVAQADDTTNALWLIMACIAMVASGIGCIWINRSAYRTMSELETCDGMA